MAFEMARVLVRFEYVAGGIVHTDHTNRVSGCKSPRSRLRAGFRCIANRMAAHRKLDQRRVYLARAHFVNVL
jgi:hypothetical protein